jgi:Flp pilus assembly protein TadG
VRDGPARRLRQLIADRCGAAAVEMALVLPVAMAFIFGIWYLGWALNCGSEVRHAVELGSRIYISNPSATSDQLRTAVASHLTDVPISAVTLTPSTQTIGSASSQHIVWSYQATEDIPVFSALTLNFSGAVDVPLATP